MSILDQIQKSFGQFADDNQVPATAADRQITPGNEGLKVSNTSAMMPTAYDAWDFVRRGAYPCVFKGLTNRSLTNFSFFLDPTIVFGAMIIDQSTLRWTVNPLRVIFDAAGVSTAPSAGLATVPVTLNYTPVIGWVIVARAVDTMSGQSNFTLTTNANGFNGSWQLADVNNPGVLFVWQASRSNSRTITWVPPSSDGTAPATSDANELIFDPLAAGAFAVTGTNVALDVFPVVLTDSVKRNLAVAIGDDALNRFAVEVAAGFSGSL